MRGSHVLVGTRDEHILIPPPVITAEIDWQQSSLTPNYVTQVHVGGVLVMERWYGVDDMGSAENAITDVLGEFGRKIRALIGEQVDTQPMAIGHDCDCPRSLGLV